MTCLQARVDCAQGELMATLLRKDRRAGDSRSRMHDLFTSIDISASLPRISNIPQQFSISNPQHSHVDLAPATESEISAEEHARGNRQASFGVLYRRLVNKASSLKLRSRIWSGNPQSSTQQFPRAHIFYAFEHDAAAFAETFDIANSAPTGTATSEDESAPFPPAIRFVTHNSSTASRSVSDLGLDLDLDHIRPQLSERFCKAHLHNNSKHAERVIWTKMAFEQAPPPVAYERLRQLTTEACDSTLSSIKAYTHANTESWNTTIINTILGALVHESTPSSNDVGTAQPSYKFIVNSTIIQHAAVSSTAGDDVVKSAGRRGMHSASGAFWNNEKDGMWSFKYEAAEAKGLDVVVGIVWIWVG